MADEKEKAIDKGKGPVGTPKEADDELSPADVEKVAGGGGTNIVCKTVCGTEWAQ
jgi:hypothetical protein